MLIYYVNLAKRTDRREAMETRLGNLGLTAERIEALTPADLGSDQIERFCDITKHNYLAPEELSCSLSHVEAMRRLLESDEPFALILEDDAVLSSKLPEFLKEFEQARPEVDVLRLETDKMPMRLAASIEFTVGSVTVHQFYSWCSGTAGYVISRAGAATIAATEEIRFKQIDRAMFNPYEPMGRQLKIRQADPALVIQQHHMGAAGEPIDSDVALGRDERDIVDNGLMRGRLRYRLLDFIDRDIRIAALKFWHQRVGGAAKRSVPFVQ